MSYHSIGHTPPVGTLWVLSVTLNCLCVACGRAEVAAGGSVGERDTVGGGVRMCVQRAVVAPTHIVAAESRRGAMGQSRACLGLPEVVHMRLNAGQRSWLMKCGHPKTIATTTQQNSS